MTLVGKWLATGSQNRRPFPTIHYAIPDAQIGNKHGTKLVQPSSTESNSFELYFSFSLHRPLCCDAKCHRRPLHCLMTGWRRNPAKCRAADAA